MDKRRRRAFKLQHPYGFFEKIFGLNVTANWRLFRSLAPLLKQAANPRVVATVSTVQMPSKPFWGAYGASQAALMTLVRTWAAENQRNTLKINMIDPGPVRTVLRAQAMPGEDISTLGEPAEIGNAILALCEETLSQTGKIFRNNKGIFAFED